MAITIDWINKLVISSSSILDLPLFKDNIRNLEDDDIGMLYPPVITYKRIDLGGGAYFHAVDFINGYKLKFSPVGDYEIIGNLNCEIIRDPGVYVERKTSAAFSTSSSGGTGSTLTAEEIRIEIDNNSVKLGEIYQILGLDINNPTVLSDTSTVSGDIEINVSGNGETLSILTRQ